MILDGKLHQIDASKPKLKEKVGGIRSCPACGESVKAMEIVCTGCGHEFSNMKANSTLLKLLADIEKINNSGKTSEQTPNDSVEDQLSTQELEMERNKRKSELIANYPIPNTREDILEFLAYSLSKGKDNSYMTYFGDSASTAGAWRKKAEEIIIKSKIMFKNDDRFYDEILQYEASLNSSLKTRKRVAILIASVVILLLVLAFGSVLVSEINGK